MVTTDLKDTLAAKATNISQFIHILENTILRSAHSTVSVSIKVLQVMRVDTEQKNTNFQTYHMNVPLQFQAFEASAMVHWTQVT